MRPRTPHPLSWSNRSHFVARVPESHMPDCVQTSPLWRLPSGARGQAQIAQP